MLALAATCFLVGRPVQAQSPALSVGHYQVVSSVRVGRTEFEYVLTADVENSGPAARVVSATVVSTSPNTVILDNALSFGDVPANARRTSSDTFKIRQNRLQTFDPNALQWTLTSLPDFAVSIEQPATGFLLNTATVQVRGSANNPPSSVVINGEVAALEGNTFSATVTLHEGNNPITAVATDGTGAAATATVQVTVDTTPPRVTIDSPRDGAVLSEPTVVVTGLINDIVVGTVGPEQAQVQVNGRPASVANRTFAIMDVPLSEGANTITAFARDQAGNTDTRSITVTRSTPVGPRIQVVSGDGQSGQIGALLPLPLVVKAADADGNPVADKRVIFKVVQNDGVISDGVTTAQSLIVTSDANGQAQVRFRLGTRAGMGNNQVSAKIVGFEGEAMFCASTTPSTPALLVLDAGNNQVGVVGQALPELFSVIVVDAGNNRLPNIPITFTVKEGGGSLNGQSTVTVNSDSNGRATTAFTLGAAPGNDNNEVEANFPGNTGLPVTFVASGQVPGDPSETSVSGMVLDNSDVPVPGALCRIVGHPDAVLSDENGYFQIKPAPVGTIRLVVDGATVTRPGSWVWLQFDLVAIAGLDNTIGRPIRLMPMDLTRAVFVDQTHGGTITLPEAPGFSLTITPGSVTFPNGTRSGNVSATIVHPDKMPDPPEFGQQPRFLITIQPANALFDPPAAMCMPNLDGLPPGQKTEMYSYDHDLGAFVAIGTGTVTEDGAVICTDPGVGVIKAGWHCGGNPNSTGSAGTCPECQKCEGNNCVPDPSQDGKPSAKDKCKICSNGSLTDIPLAPAVAVTLGGIGPPAPVVDQINEALEELKKVGIIASVNLLQVTLNGSRKECCEATLGKGEELSASASGDFGGFSVKGKVWPPGPIPTFGPREIDVFGLASLTVKAEFVGGVFIGIAGTVTGEIGRKKNDCSLDAADRAGCFFAELKTSLTLSLSAEIGGSASLTVDCVLCDKTTISIEASFIAGELSWPIDITSVSYNKSSCSSGLSGGIFQFNPGTFKVSAKFSGSYEIEGFGKRNVNVTLDFLDCEITTSGVSCK